MKRLLAAIATVTALTACSDSRMPTSPEPNTRPATDLVLSDGSIPGNYIVQADWNTNAAALAAEFGIKPKYVYEELINGFAGALPSIVADALAADPRVLRVVVQRKYSKIETVTQSGVTWGIDRIDQRALPLNSTYAYDYTEPASLRTSSTQAFDIPIASSRDARSRGGTHLPRTRLIRFWDTMDRATATDTGPTSLEQSEEKHSASRRK